ncbi:MAG: hypothetical protein BA861_10830 [Desulfobacterales bacterium S3730MH5]|nr:MAG: hypothetical protein BA861_10830 [Desulfobacterales bacterium S3730MH5]
MSEWTQSIASETESAYQLALSVEERLSKYINVIAWPDPDSPTPKDWIELLFEVVEEKDPSFFASIK